jgi:hypothetical protein
MRHRISMPTLFSRLLTVYRGIALRCAMTYIPGVGQAARRSMQWGHVGRLRRYAQNPTKFTLRTFSTKSDDESTI